VADLPGDACNDRFYRNSDAGMHQLHIGHMMQEYISVAATDRVSRNSVAKNATERVFPKKESFCKKESICREKRKRKEGAFALPLS
jgi:hypothetical protein